MTVVRGGMGRDNVAREIRRVACVGREGHMKLGYSRQLALVQHTQPHKSKFSLMQ